MGTKRGMAMFMAAMTAIAACSGGDDTTEPTPPPGTAEPAGAAAPASSAASTTVPVTEERPSDGPVIVTLAPDTAPEPVQGGVLRIGLSAEVDGLNPTASALTAASGLMMAAAVFDKLAELTPEGDWVPFLAQSFTPNDDHTVWDVDLRPGIVFHDGTPLDAEAVRVNFAAQYEDSLVGLALRTQYAGPEAAEVIDADTVRFHLLDPNAHWPVSMASQLGMIASPTWIAAALADPTLNQQPVGTGPFRFVSRSEDAATIFERNDEWWNGEVYLDRIEYISVADSPSRGELLAAGEIDGLHTVDPAVIDDFRDADGFTALLNDSSEETFFMVNTTAPPFDDLRVRRALALATPKAAYVDLIGLGVVRAADQMFIPESPFHNPDVHQEADDPAAAAALVAEYCAERGAETNPVTGQPTCIDGKVQIEYQYPSDMLNGRIADLVIDSWRSVFEITRQELIGDQHISQTVLGQYNAVIWQGFGALNPTSDWVWISCRSIGGISLNFPRYCDEERDAAMLAAQATTDPEVRAEQFQEVVRMMNESGAYVFMTHTMWMHAYRDGVHGMCDRQSPEGVPLACAIGGAIWPVTMYLT